MEMTGALQLAHEVGRSLRGLVWGIGGSVLLGRLGVETHPNDLDVVTANSDFEQAFERLTRRFGEAVPGVGDYRLSERFARFVLPSGKNVDLVAFIRRNDIDPPCHFMLTKEKIEVVGGLPWMKAEDWLLIYSLFERPNRVSQLRDYLDRRQAVRTGAISSK